MKEFKFTGSYYVHPDLPNVKIYAKNTDEIPAYKGVDKSKYILINK